MAEKNDKANESPSKFKKIDETLDKELVCTKTDGIKFDFNRFVLSLKFIEKNHNYEITLDEAINDEKDLNILKKN